MPKIPSDWGQEEGYKRSITTCLKQLKQGGIPVNDDEFWLGIQQIVWTTVQILRPSLESKYNNIFAPMYRQTMNQSINAKSKPYLHNANRDESKGSTCRSFQFLGFDILMDEKQKLYLLEVNQNPSFYVGEADIDDYIKKGVFGKGLSILKLIERLSKYSS